MQEREIERKIERKRMEGASLIYTRRGPLSPLAHKAHSHFPSSWKANVKHSPLVIEGVIRYYNHALHQNVRQLI